MTQSSRQLEVQVEQLRAEIARRDAEIARLKAENFRLAHTHAPEKERAHADREAAERAAALADNKLQEVQLQRSMLAALQAERATNLAYIEELKDQMQSSGADSARVAVRRAVTMFVRAVRRRVPFLRTR